MKTYVAYILCLFLYVASSDANPIENENITLSKTDVTLCSFDGLFGCTDDLTGQKYCMFGREVTINCLTQTGKPECDPQTYHCVEKPNPPCVCEEEEDYPLLCPATGFYPHPLNCSKYIICPPSKSTIVSDCFGLVYDPLDQVCSRETKCYTFSAVDGLCKGKDGSIVAHPLNQAIYAYCYGDVPLMSQCPKGQIFNVNKLRCECGH